MKSETMAPDPILDSLNDEQRRAVLCKDGPVLIIAGAGSGKTRVLTSRIALLLRDGVDPRQILALTFTKKAAGEMRERIRTMAGPAADGLVMGTFHSVFVRFLRRYAGLIGFRPEFTIYDQDDAESCLKNVICEVLFGPLWNDRETLKTLTQEDKDYRKKTLAKYKTKEVASRISGYKNAYLMPKKYRESEAAAADLRHGRGCMGDIYELYMLRCRKASAMDFDDILVYTFFLMEKYPDVAAQIAHGFRYILVDEYQDTNTIQYDIVSILAQAHRNICAVGDDSQSIYAFRGARIQNILNFRSDYPDYKSFKLETNYRSTPEIVEAANRLITFNETRMPKECKAVRHSGRFIDVVYPKNDREEARYITMEIQARHEAGKPWSSNAVLYRTNAQSRALEDALIRARVPYIIYSGLSFFERMEVKDVLAYLRLAVNPDDEEAFKRVCNRPARGISDATLTALQAASVREDRTIYQVSCDILSHPCGLRGNAAAAVDAFRKLIDESRNVASSKDAYEAAKAIIELSGIYTFYDKDKDEDGQRRTANIDELVNGILYFLEDQKESPEEGNPRTSLADWLENVALLSAVDRQDDKDKDAVALMTSHCSKGLEFPTVFIAGVEEGLYPALRQDSSQFDLEEERRLFYVSVTRAKDELILTSCSTRWKYGDVQECEESRFINEMLPLD